jgi:hypothetical protein
MNRAMSSEQQGRAEQALVDSVRVLEGAFWQPLIDRQLAGWNIIA